MIPVVWKDRLLLFWLRTVLLAPDVRLDQKPFKPTFQGSLTYAAPPRTCSSVHRNRKPPCGPVLE